MERLRRGDVGLAVFDDGPRDAEPVLLVHGFPDTHRVWDGVTRLLSSTHRVLRYDVRGAGASTAPTDDAAYRLEHLAADLCAVAALAGRPVHLVGHDWGGIQSWEALATNPHIFRTFTAISGPCLDHSGAQLRAARGDLSQLPQVLRQLAASWYVGVFHLPFAPRLARWAIPRAAARLGARPEEMVTLADDAAHGTALYRANVRERMRDPRPRTIALPVQIVVPSEDRYVTPRLAESARPYCPEFTRADVEGDHWVLRRFPERIAPLLVAHFARS